MKGTLCKFSAFMDLGLFQDFGLVNVIFSPIIGTLSYLQDDPQLIR